MQAAGREGDETGAETEAESGALLGPPVAAIAPSPVIAISPPRIPAVLPAAGRSPPVRLPISETLADQEQRRHDLELVQMRAMGRDVPR
eukprot:1229537-Rhodomonas_salina.1